MACWDSKPAFTYELRQRMRSRLTYLFSLNLTLSHTLRSMASVAPMSIGVVAVLCGVVVVALVLLPSCPVNTHTHTHTHTHARARARPCNVTIVCAGHMKRIVIILCLPAWFIYCTVQFPLIVFKRNVTCVLRSESAFTCDCTNFVSPLPAVIGELLR